MAAWRAEQEARRKKKARGRSRDFYASVAWRRMRYAVLAANAGRNDGVARCELCGTAAAAGSPLHVDHIEPLSRAWARRLDRTNLQVLCGNCNGGKLAGPAQDFRPAEVRA